MHLEDQFLHVVPYLWSAGVVLLEMANVSPSERMSISAPAYVSETVHPASNIPDSVFQIGEQLTYNVSYASIDIGQIRIELIDTVKRSGVTCYQAAAYIDSYKGVPFVNLHSVFEDEIHPTGYAMWFSARNEIGHRWTAVQYSFDYPNHALYVEKGIWKSGKVDEQDTVRIDTLYQDGLSLLYYVREHVLTRQRSVVPTIVSEEKGTTYIHFTTEHSRGKVEAVPYPIDLVHFTGEADFVGIFGLTGAFEGWFSNDAARVPVIAEMKVLIGSIHVELVNWKRQGWIPPPYREDTLR